MLVSFVCRKRQNTRMSVGVGLDNMDGAPVNFALCLHKSRSGSLHDGLAAPLFWSAAADCALPFHNFVRSCFRIVNN